MFHSGYAYRTKFDPRAREVGINDPAATVDVWVSVTPGLPSTLDFYPIVLNASGGNNESSKLTVKVLPNVWDHNHARTKRFTAELVKALYEVNHQPLTRALKEAVTKKAMNRSGWSTPEQEASRGTTLAPSRPATIQKGQGGEPQPAPIKDRFNEVMDRLDQIANRPIEVNVAPPNVTIAEGAIKAQIVNQTQRGDLEIKFPDGRKTTVKRT